MPAVYIMLQENPCTLLQFKDIVEEPWNFEVSKYPQVSTDASVHVTTTTKRLYKCGQCGKCAKEKKMVFRRNTIAKLQFDDQHINEDKKYERMLVGNLLLADHF